MKIKNLDIRRGFVLALAGALSVYLIYHIRESDCTEKDYHVHKYEKGKIVRFLPREQLHYQGYNWTDKVYFTDPDFYEYLDQERLLQISENRTYIQQVQNSQKDYLEYERAGTWVNPVGKLPRTIPMTDWTTDPNKGNTCRTRVCHTQYYGYKIEKDEKGNRYLVKSPLVDNLLEIEDEYPFFRDNNFKETVKYSTNEDAYVYQK